MSVIALPLLQFALGVVAGLAIANITLRHARRARASAAPSAAVDAASAHGWLVFRDERGSFMGELRFDVPEGVTRMEVRLHVPEVQ